MQNISNFANERITSMNIELEIPKEFECDFNSDREIAKMFITSFKKSKVTK